MDAWEIRLGRVIFAGAPPIQLLSRRISLTSRWIWYVASTVKNIPLDEAARCFSEFYRLRREAGLPTEKSYGLKHAVVDNPHATLSQLRQMLKTSPFPRFERQGLLDLSEDERYFVVNPALLEALTPMVRESLRRKAVGRLVEHFGEDEGIIEGMVKRVVGEGREE